MKLRHWFNLILISSMAAAIAYFVLQWAVKTYADPTCQAYAASHGLTYIGFLPNYTKAGGGTTHATRAGECQVLNANGEPDEVTLVTASEVPGGPPFLITLAVTPIFVFGTAFFLVALVVALMTRPFAKSRG